MKKSSWNKALRGLSAVIAVNMMLAGPATVYAEEGELDSVMVAAEDIEECELLEEEIVDENTEDNSESALEENNTEADDIAADEELIEELPENEEDSSAEEASDEENANSEDFEEELVESEDAGDVSANSVSAPVLEEQDVVVLDNVFYTKGTKANIKVTGMSNSNNIYNRYLGKPFTFDNLKVTDDGAVLTEGKDYTIRYENNNAASTDKKQAYVVITFRDRYCGTKKIPFTINKGWICPISTPSQDVVVAYTGKTIKIHPKIYHYGVNNEKRILDEEHKVLLKEGRDYELQYLDLGDKGAFKEPGSYYVAVAAKGNYENISYVRMVITKDKLAQKLSVSRIANQVCAPDMKKPSVVVKDGAKVLTEGKEYRITFTNWNTVGTATAVIEGNPAYGYQGKKTITYKVVGQNIAKAKVSGIENQVYTGRELKQGGLKVFFPATKTTAEKVLSAGKDYTVTYSNNTNAGKATVTIQGTGYYSGTIRKTFTISPYTVSQEDDKLSIHYSSTSPYLCCGTIIDASIVYNGNYLYQNKDYTITYKNNRKVTGTGPKATAIFKFKGNYKGTATREFTVTSGSVKNSEVIANDVVYTNKKGNAVTSVTLREWKANLVAGRDYDKNIKYFIDGKQVDLKTIIVNKNTVVTGTIYGIGAYQGTKTTFEYRVVERKLDANIVLVDENLKPFVSTFRGEPYGMFETNYKVYDKKTKRFLNSSQYKQTLCENTIGSKVAYITIEGIGEYGGTKTFTVKIKPKEVN